MIQRIPKVNVMGIVAMCATFLVSALLVHGFEAKSILNPFHPKLASKPTESGTAKNTIPPGMIRYQAEAPIRFVRIEINYAPQSATLIAKNVSGRTITGYSLAYILKGDPATMISVSNFDRTMDSHRGLDKYAVYRSEVDPNQIKEAWVDFVEFSDGTIWGPNTTKTLEKMNATRIGSRQAALEYKWVLDAAGPQAMLASLSNPIKNTQIEGHDEIWGRAFDSGVEEVSEQLLSDKAAVDVPAHITTSLGGSHRSYNDQLTDRFQATLSSYINFRRQ